MDLVLEKMVAFRLPEVEGLGRNVKGLPTDLMIEICQGMVAALDASMQKESTTKLTNRQLKSPFVQISFSRRARKLALMP